MRGRHGGAGLVAGAGLHARGAQVEPGGARERDRPADGCLRRAATSARTGALYGGVPRCAGVVPQRFRQRGAGRTGGAPAAVVEVAVDTAADRAGGPAVAFAVPADALRRGGAGGVRGAPELDAAD